MYELGVVRMSWGWYVCVGGGVYVLGVVCMCWGWCV